MNEQYTELMQAAQLLQTVTVDGRYWHVMLACYNSIIKVAGEIRPKEAEEGTP